ncbi:hypothetical protein HUJ04_006100 [Dendroctonus ponderosae]|nr:hypothetical protein HUJ04_006100 [Dendroctonus ponderosae]
MSLSGYMPPLCDPQDGHLLLDGGYTNNLPEIADPVLKKCTGIYHCATAARTPNYDYVDAA